MKMVVAIIRPEKLPAVKTALAEEGIGKMTVTNVIGAGQQGGFTEVYRGAEFEVNLLKKVRIELAINDDFEQKAVDTLIKSARTGNIGDGKIFIYDLPRCLRIRTGEEGSAAIG